MNIVNCSKCEKEFSMPDGSSNSIICEDCDSFLKPAKKYMIIDEINKLDKENLAIHDFGHNYFVSLDDVIRVINERL